MSIHRSLKTSGRLIRARNVWTRLERIQVLQKEDRWKEGDPITGLPKVRTRFKTKSKKQLKAEAKKAQEAGTGKEKEEEKPAE